MSKDDLQDKIKKITVQAKNERKQESAQEKAIKMEVRKTARAESEARKMETRRAANTEPEVKSKPKETENTSYTAVIIVRLEYEGNKVPEKERLAEDLGNTIIKWTDQKGFYGISPKESVPRLISVNVDIE